MVANEAGVGVTEVINMVEKCWCNEPDSSSGRPGQASGEYLSN